MTKQKLSEDDVKQMWLVILKEGFDGDTYKTLIKDPRLIDWINEPVSFKPEQSRVHLQIPGTELIEEITIGSPYEDKLIAITGDEIPDNMSEACYNKYAHVRRTFEKYAPDRIIEGMVY